MTNLSKKLVGRLTDIFPNSVHVSQIYYQSALDEKIWEYAFRQGFSILTKDTDFNALSIIRGCPPKVIHLNMGNCTTGAICSRLIEFSVQIKEFIAQSEHCLLEII